MNDTPTRGCAGGGPRRLIEAAQQGDHAAQQELVRSYEPLVQRVVWRLRLPPGCERDDVAQEARIGLLAAIRAWRPERGPFPAFADRCVRNQALLALEAACRHKHQLLSLAVSLDSQRDGYVERARERRGVTLRDTLPAARDAWSDPESRLLVREQLTSVLGALPALTRNERQALAGVLAGDSYQHLAPTLGRTP